MSRPIKLRGRSTVQLVGDDQWLYGFGVHVVELADGGEEWWLYTENGTYQVDPETVGQYTDYYGLEFYDNDIIAIFCDCDSEFGCYHRDGIYKVTWNCETAGYALERQHDGKLVSLDEYGEENMRVIGNVWENPELWEGDSKDA